MRILYFILTALLFSFFAKGQKKFPFDEKLLRQLTMDYNNDTIFPVYKKGSFVYINIKTKDSLFNKRFTEAYPFIKNSALVFDKQTNSYNIIDREGNYGFEQGMLKGLSETHHPLKSVVRFVTSENNRQQTFLYNLYESKVTGEYVKPNICAEAVAPPQIDRMANGKYRLFLPEGKQVVFDEIKAVHPRLFIVKSKGYYGAIDAVTGKVVLPVEYDDYAEIDTSQIVALKKKGIWYYYGFQLFKSKHLFHHYFVQDSFDKRFGIFRDDKNKSNIMFKDKSLLSRGFDRISENGILANDTEGYYFIPFNSKNIVVYYQNQ